MVVMMAAHSVQMMVGSTVGYLAVKMVVKTADTMVE